jgi:hypothetical protein
VVFRTPPEVVSGIGRGGGGGVQNHLEVTSVPPNTTYRTPPPSVKVRKALGVQNFLCPWIKFWGCVKVKLQEGK